jgi:glucans biosynthesis protein
VQQKEEFPRFTDFWVGKPAAGDQTLTIYALLNAPSVAGAYEFVVRPGPETWVDVRSELDFRHGVTLLGVAPFTSMFWFGENSDRAAGQLRLQVHDSDGLLMQDAVSHLWRPLHNPSAVENFDFPAQSLVRFGLMQRNRQIGGYEDLEAHYEQRPSAWIEPQGDWGAGKVRLVELPGPAEHDDNIVAFWVPASSPVPGRPVDFNYRIVWSLGEPPGGGVARVVGTREGPLPHVDRGHLFWVDFAGEKPASGAEVKAEVELGAEGHLRNASVIPYPEIGGWRVAIEVDAAEAKKTIGVQCRLRAGDKPISETWTYDWRS